jgi:hypothetical protein
LVSAASIPAGSREPSAISAAGTQMSTLMSVVYA